ncbi:MAG TPA: NAD(P)-dependent oxidoreductase [Bacteroidota bacterium]|nr:NAD(P)-dependent oxidoreductase [Bacteroidota bacterium]
MDVFFYEAFGDEAKKLGELLGSDVTYGFARETIAEAGHKTPPARLISIRTQSVVPPEWEEHIDGVLSRSTGFDHLVVLASKIHRTLPLGYLEEYATRAVAEHAILLAMALLRKLPQQIRQFSVFNRENLTGPQCLGKNMLVVGVGRIGSEIVNIARGLGFNVKGIDTAPGKSRIEYVGKEEGIRWADVIVCAMNLTEENRGYFSYDLLSQAKRACVFVNIARGELSPLDAIERLLAESKLAGVGLDVFEEEGALGASLRNPEGRQAPHAHTVKRLLEYPNVLFTPHNAFNSVEALQLKSEFTVQQVRHFLKTRDFLLKI